MHAVTHRPIQFCERTCGTTVELCINLYHYRRRQLRRWWPVVRPVLGSVQALSSAYQAAISVWFQYRECRTTRRLHQSLQHDECADTDAIASYYAPYTSWSTIIIIVIILYTFVWG